MRFIKATFLAASTLLFACSKKDVQVPVSREECAVTYSSISGQPIPDQYIVVYNETASRDQSASRMENLAKQLLQKNSVSPSSIRASFAGKLPGFVARMNAAQAAKLKSDPSVRIVEQDRFIALSTCFTVAAPSLITWNIHKVGFGNGIGKTAWVVDTGIDMDHPDLSVDQQRSRSYISGNTSPDDDHGHGTHVAGIIGAKNNTIGTLGVASGATLVALKVLDEEGKGSTSGIIQALAYINQVGKPGDVVNLSLGEEVVSTTLDLQVQNTASKGILIAVAAGNDAKPANKFSPGRANGTNIFTVSAVDSLNRFASFSNYGNDVVDYAAPGVQILSTYKNGMYAKMSGTSMAAPHVAGLLLLNGRNLHFSGTAVNDPDGEPDKIASRL